MQATWPTAKNYKKSDNYMNYKELLSQYSAAPTAAEVADEVARIAALAPRNETPEVWKFCFSAIDLTTLNSTDSDRSVREFVEKAMRLGVDFPQIPPVASICVYPSFVDVVGLTLGNSPIAITSVAGGFPSSQTFIEVKMLEVAMAVESGADEVDVVITIGEMLDGEYDRMASTLEILREEVGENAVLKVIIESGALKTPELIRTASLLSMFAGADFVKTSTGKIDVAATPEAAVVMCHAVRDYYEKTGRKVGFKVAGGVRNAKDSALYYTIVEEILGAEWLTPSLFRIGASSLANNLLSTIEGRDIKYF
jgi:deoxyribose-phosphate aldolase